MRTSSLSSSVTWAWLVMLMLCSSTICAQSPPGDAAHDHYELGISAAERKDYKKALSEFQISYSIRQVPRLLINIGRAQYRLGNLHEAIDAYENYLKTEPNAPLSITSRVKTFLAEAKNELQTTNRHIDEVRSPRPLWRWLAGGAISSGGLLVLGLGAYSWAQDGSCVGMPTPPSNVCENVYDTKSVGIPMVVVGGVTLAVGVAIMAWPGKTIRR